MLTNRLFYRRDFDKRTCILWAPVLCFGACTMLWGQAQKQTTESPTDPLQEARELLNGHDLEGARRVLEHTVDRSPRSAEAWLLLADTYSQLNMESEAMRGYETVLRLNPESSSALYNLAILQLRCNRPQKAVQYLEILHKQNSRDPEVLVLSRPVPLSNGARCRRPAYRHGITEHVERFHRSVLEAW